jgi:hypothetical protein
MAADDDVDAPVDPLKMARHFLAMAIGIGAPAYNQGDHRGCFEVYACAARLLLNSVKGADEVKRKLQDALEVCCTEVDVDKQAWTMRRAFDCILGEDGD